MQVDLMPEMTEYSFRRAGPDDAPTIASVHVASWKTTYPGIVKQAYIDALSVEERTRAWGRAAAERGVSGARRHRRRISVIGCRRICLGWTDSTSRAGVRRG